MSKIPKPPLRGPSSDSKIPKLVEDVFFQPLSKAMEKVNTRSCPAVDDYSFVKLCLLQALTSSKSGRDFIQTHGIPNLDTLNRGNYFDSLCSPRRLSLITEVGLAMTQEFLPSLRTHDDLLISIPELDGWEVWLADGHTISHGTHDKRNEKEEYSPVRGIYKLDQRTGWSEFIDLSRPTVRGIEAEITTLKRQDKELFRCGAPRGKFTLIAYDSAALDFVFGYNLKQSKGTCFVTDWKSNLAPMTLIEREIDHSNPVNALIVSDETAYFERARGTWRKIIAGCPDSDELYITLTNEMTLPPGALNQVRRLRWNIEKAFDQQEQKLDERKAWTSNENGKRIQAIAICIAHNLLKLFTAKLKREEDIEETKLIQAWHENLASRIVAAREVGRELPEKLYKALYRPTEISLQFIRWLRCALFRPTCYRRALELL